MRDFSKLEWTVRAVSSDPEDGRLRVWIVHTTNSPFTRGQGLFADAKAMVEGMQLPNVDISYTSDGKGVPQITIICPSIQGAKNMVARLTMAGIRKYMGPCSKEAITWYNMAKLNRIDITDQGETVVYPYTDEPAKPSESLEWYKKALIQADAELVKLLAHEVNYKEHIKYIEAARVESKSKLDESISMIESLKHYIAGKATMIQEHERTIAKLKAEVEELKPKPIQVQVGDWVTITEWKPYPSGIKDRSLVGSILLVVDILGDKVTVKDWSNGIPCRSMGTRNLLNSMVYFKKLDKCDVQKHLKVFGCVYTGGF